MANLSTLWLASNQLTGTIPPQLADIAALEVLDLRDNPLTWPPPTALAEPQGALTALLPDTHSWVPPAPTITTIDPGDGELQIAWDHPGAGTDYQNDTYTINHRPQNKTGAFTQATATASPVTISGLTNATTYDIFITATNTAGTSNPSPTAAAAPTSTATRYAGFDDVSPTNVHASAIAGLATARTGVFGADGVFNRTLCGTASFCPYSAILRETMAVWLTRVLLGQDPTSRTRRFLDVGYWEWWNPHVTYFAAEGITAGCRLGSNYYCPQDSVTRAQMASFLVRAFPIPELDPTEPAPVFLDVSDSSSHADNIKRLAAARITSGCHLGPDYFCPNDPTTRAQMANTPA